MLATRGVIDLTEKFVFFGAGNGNGFLFKMIFFFFGKGEQIYSVEEQEEDPDLEALPKLTKMLETLSETFKDKDFNDMNLENKVSGNITVSRSGDKPIPFVSIV